MSTSNKSTVGSFFLKQSLLHAFLFVLVLVACSCHGPGVSVVELTETRNLRDFDQFLVNNAPVSVYPGRHWVVTDDGEWKFSGVARVMVWLPEAGREPLKINLTPSGLTDRFHFKFSWDGEELGGGRDTLADLDNTIEIPLSMLGEGVHDFFIERERRRDKGPARKVVKNVFEAIGFRMGDFGDTLNCQDFDHLRYVGSLLEFGVTGLSNQKRSGCVFDGPGALSAEVLIEKSGQLEYVVENGSSKSAEFSLKVGSERQKLIVEAGEAGIIDIDVEAGVQPIRFDVQGADEGAFLWASPVSKSALEERRTPIILITLDTTRKDVLTPYGGPADATPVLDEFARTSTLFENAYASSPWTLPSHASMMTGRYPSLHGAGVTSDWVSPRLPKLATLMAQAGFVTAGFAGGEMCASRWGVARGFQRYDDPEAFETPGDTLSDRVIETVESIAGNAFFVFINYFDPHAPYQPPQRFADIFDVAGKAALLGDTGPWRDFVDGNGVGWGDVVDGNVVPTPEALEYLTAAYRAEVAFMDAGIGRFFEVLKQNGIFDKALIIVVADHGEFLGEGGFFSHGCRLDPELVEVPLLIKWPGQKEGARRADLVSHVDLFSTMLAVAGIETPAHDGIVITENSSHEFETRSVVFVEEHECRIHPLIKRMKIAPHLFGLQQLRRREVVWNGGMTCADLEAQGWIDSTCDATWQERLRDVGSAAKALRERDEDHGPGELSDDERQRLEALGYIN